MRGGEPRQAGNIPDTPSRSKKDQTQSLLKQFAERTRTERLKERSLEVNKQFLQGPFGHILSPLRGVEVEETPEKEVCGQGVDIYATGK